MSRELTKQLDITADAGVKPDRGLPVPQITGATLLIGVAFLLFAANDNMPGGGPDDEDDLMENLKELYNKVIKRTGTNG